MKAYGIKVNRLSRAFGIDACKPVISWCAEGGVTQSAFRIVMNDGEKDIYDSGEVKSCDMAFFTETPIKSRTQITATLALCDEDGRWGDAVPFSFETGIAKDEWVAKWIDPELVHPEYTRLATDDKPLNKASYLRREFELKKIGKARLYATAHGVYNIYLNGTEVEGYYMAPGSSDYEKRLQVQTYDISDLLKEGKNEIIVTVGEGWWRGSTGWSMFRYNYGTEIAFLCQLEMDGTPVLVTDGDWQASQSGPLMENDTMRLERYDARRVITDWHEVTIKDYGYENLCGTDIPITKHERFKARLVTTPNGERMLDFGQNFAGFVEFDLYAKGGETITLTHGEVLSADGNFQNDNFQNPDSPICRQVVEYTCKPGRNIFHQTKCYYGFRYAKIETELDITGEEFTGVAVYSDMQRTADFECGVPELNRFFENVIWSMKSNFVDVPTDCPHREKLGFTGDCQVFSSAALYLMDSYPVLRRWLRESVSCQLENGCILYIAPPLAGPQKEAGWIDGSAGWSNSMTIVPERFLHYLNSPTELEEFYPAIKKWVNYNLGVARSSRPENEHLPEHIRNYVLDCATNWGEWCEPGWTSKDYAIERERTGHAEIATAFLAYDCYLAAIMARALGKEEDAKYYTDIYEKTKAAYLYVYTDNGSINSDRQCHYVRPVAHKLLDGEDKNRAVNALVELIRKNGNKIGTGFLTTCHIMEALTDNGYQSVAYDLLLQTEAPSWIYEVKMGATTVWESWFGAMVGKPPRASHNHYSLGAVAGWMMSRVLGITVSDGEITIRPYVDERLGYAKGSYDSLLGKISSEWKCTESGITLSFEIPSNATATIILPDGRCEKVDTGRYIYNIKHN